MFSPAPFSALLAGSPEGGRQGMDLPARPHGSWQAGVAFSWLFSTQLGHSPPAQCCPAMVATPAGSYSSAAAGTSLHLFTTADIMAVPQCYTSGGDAPASERAARSCGVACECRRCSCRVHVSCQCSRMHRCLQTSGLASHFTGAASFIIVIKSCGHRFAPVLASRPTG